MFTPMMRVVPLLSRRYSTKIKSASYDAIIIGGGHNGLVCSAYLKKNRPNWNVLVVERRHLIGGAAVTEEIVPGFKFSRASYLCSLFRHQILDDLKIRDKITLIGRNPSSFTPILDGRHLFMGPDHSFNYEQVSKFSKKDADNLKPYEDMLNHYAASFEQLLDLPPFDPTSVSKGLMKGLSEQSDSIKLLMREVGKIGPSNIPEFAELLTAPASKLLRRYFESEPLISTLATDAIIGAFASPSSPGSAYVLLHHVMGDVGFGRGVWAYVKGGMGALSDAIADAARGYGVEIVTDVGVSSITTKNNKASGVILSDGTEISASKCVISNLNAYTTCNDLLSEQDKQNLMPESFMNNVRNIDFESATFKINLAVDRIPQFKCMKKMEASQHHGPEHVGTIHIGENSQQVEDAYNYARAHSEPSKVPIIEMTIPSSLDHTLAPEGKHVVQLFIQYAPYTLSKGTWDDPGRREAFANSVYDTIEQYAPGFKSSIIGQDLLSPLDLERVFGLKGGNIFHGSVGLDQLYFNRPVTGGYSRHAMPVDGLYLAGSAAHPGGGVMGAPGRNCSMVVLNKYK